MKAEKKQPDAPLNRLAGGLAVLGVVVLLLMAFGIVADAFGRAFLGGGVHGLEDMNGLLIPAVVAAFIPILFAEDGNVAVRLIGKAVGPRATLWFDVFGHFAAFVFIAILAWQYLLYADDLSVRHSLILEWPLAPTAILAGVLLCFAALLQAQLVRDRIKKIRAGRVIERVRR